MGEHEYTISVADWVNDSAVGESCRGQRKRLVKRLEQSYGAPFSQILQDIRAERTDVYRVCRTLCDDMRQRFLPYSFAGYRSYLPDLFQSTIGESYCSKSVFNRLCPTGPVYVTHAKLSPPRDKVVEMLRTAYPLTRAIIGVLAVTGMRVGEVIPRRMSDMEIRPEGYARIGLKAQDTKAKYARYTFVTKECVDWIRDYHKFAGIREPECIFPGEYSNRKPITNKVPYKLVKPMFRRVGLLDAQDKSEIYTAHSFRTFAGDQMRECGLTEKYVLAIIGHKNHLGAESHYLDWRKIEESWREKCADKMTFLDTSVAANKKVEELTRTNGKLELLLEKLLERLS